MDKTLAELIENQAGMVARRQLNALGIDSDHVRHQIAAGRWEERTPRVVSTVTGDLTFDQRCWLGVLHAGPRAMLGNLTAAAHHDLKNWDRPDICVLVDDELSFDPVYPVHVRVSRWLQVHAGDPSRQIAEEQPTRLIAALERRA